MAEDRGACILACACVCNVCMRTHGRTQTHSLTYFQKRFLVCLFILFVSACLSCLALLSRGLSCLVLPGLVHCVSLPALYVSVCLSVCLSVGLTVCLSACLSVGCASAKTWRKLLADLSSASNLPPCIDEVLSSEDQERPPDEILALSSFRAGFRSDSNWESFKIGPPAGRRADFEASRVRIRPGSSTSGREALLRNPSR